MKTINVREIMAKAKIPLLDKLPSERLDKICKTVSKVIEVDKINEALIKFSDRKNFDFIEAFFRDLNFSYKTTFADNLVIPKSGRLVCISNHPLGALDGLSILLEISKFRKDVYIVVNNILLYIDNLKELFLPSDVYSHKAQRSTLERIDTILEEEKTIVFFPAGAVSRMTPFGQRDCKWTFGAIKFALRHEAPILPIFVKAYNSCRYYITSTIYRKLALFLLPHEIFRKRNKKIELVFGNIIKYDDYSTITNMRVLNEILKVHLFYLKKDKNAKFIRLDEYTPENISI